MDLIDQKAIEELLDKHQAWFDAKNENPLSDTQGMLRIEEKTIRDCGFQKRNFSCSEMIDCRFENVKFLECDFTGASLMDSQFINCEFKTCLFVKSLMKWAQSEGCEYIDCHMARAEFGNANMNSCNLTGSNLSGAYFDSTDLRNVIWGGVRLRGTDIHNAKVFNTKRFKVAQLETLSCKGNDFSEAGDGSVILDEQKVDRLFFL
jgi:uncharacterized protein YjbI with pentapeptide repeats